MKIRTPTMYLIAFNMGNKHIKRYILKLFMAILKESIHFCRRAVFVMPYTLTVQAKDVWFVSVPMLISMIQVG